MGRVSGESMETTFMTQIFKSFKAAANLQAQPKIRRKGENQKEKHGSLRSPSEQSKELMILNQETNPFCLPSIHRSHVHDISHI